MTITIHGMVIVIVALGLIIISGAAELESVREERDQLLRCAVIMRDSQPGERGSSDHRHCLLQITTVAARAGTAR